MIFEGQLPGCFDLQVYKYLDYDFKPSVNLTGIRGLTVLLPTEHQIKNIDESDSYKLWLSDYWKHFLGCFRETVSEKCQCPQDHSLDLFVLHHMLVDNNGRNEEHIVGKLADPLNQIAVPPFHILDVVTNRASVLTKDGWQNLAAVTPSEMLLAIPLSA